MRGEKTLKIKKTATITFHKAINYGAVLQTYALQQSILKLGVDNEVIDYSTKAIDDEYRLIKINSIKSFIKSCIIFPNFYYKKKNFKKFIDKYIHLTKYLTKSDLTKSDFSDKYDLFIVGSDQVWNYKLINNDATYLLDFVKYNEKKVSYAASFGIDIIPNKLFSWYKNNLNSFNKILLREKTGEKLLNDLLHKKASIVLDPVFLLSQDSWNSILQKTKFDDMSNEYILIYMSTPKIKKYAYDLSKKYNLKIFHITDFLLNQKIKIGNLEKELSPNDFISAIKNAKFVVTSSFHGIVFSIIFNKIFFVDSMDKSKSLTSSRQKDILELLEVGDRQISVNKNDEDFIPIDWTLVNKKLSLERNKSLCELKNLLRIEE